MTARKRLVLFVEGQGDQVAAPILIKKLLTEASAWDCVSFDRPAMRVGDLGSLLTKDGEKLGRLLKEATKSHKPLGGVLLLLDGDAKSVLREPFCVVTHACRLASIAVNSGAGKTFSVGVTFARMEFESWLIACADRLAGRLFSDGREGIRIGTTPPASDLEAAPRAAKEWLAKQIDAGYKESIDQALLTELMIDHLDCPRLAAMSSFARLKRVVGLLVAAIRSGDHIANPTAEIKEAAP